MSRDLVEQVTSLPEEVHYVRFRPEDAYTGYLVKTVNERTNFTVSPVRRSNAFRLSYKCGEFNAWFYHGMRTSRMGHLFGLMNSNSPRECKNKEKH